MYNPDRISYIFIFRDTRVNEMKSERELLLMTFDSMKKERRPFYKLIHRVKNKVKTKSREVYMVDVVFTRMDYKK